MHIPNPLISVVLPLRDHVQHAAAAVRSVVNQSHRPIELIVVDSAGDAGCMSEIEAIAAAAPEAIALRVISKKNCSSAESINAGLAAAQGEHIALISADDVYTPDRLARCVVESNGAGIVLTHILPADEDGQPLRIGDKWRADYERMLILHIAAFPSLSCLSVCMNIVATPGNLFIPRDMLAAVGEFADYPNLHYLDFFLRASLHREPVLIREKLLVHRVRSASNASAPRRNTEHAAIIRKQLLRLWSGARPANPLADVFEAHAFLFGQTGWSQALNEAFDGLLEYREPSDERPADSVAPVQVAPADCPREFTLVTHELSLTGAPVIVLEIASLLRERGCRVKVLSLTDGPLKAEFTKRGIRTVTPPLLLDRIARLHVRTLHWAMRGRRFPEKIVNRLIGALRKFSGWAWQSQLWVHVRGILLVNSVAAWPVATQLPVVWRRPAFWYIHETLDLQWLIPGEETSSRLRQLVAGGRLKMLYGSEATRLHWAANHYDGRVRYWSGVSKTTDYLGPASDRGRGQQRARRVILNIGMVGGRKGTRTLVEAFALGRAEGLIPADVELCIVGCQLPSEHLEARDLVRRIYQPDLRGHVRAVHSVVPVVLRSYYREADVYAHASIFDCMPIALLTAMAHGLPIVATDVDGCKEAIEHETSGLLVQHGKPRQMAEALGRLFAEPDQARALGTAARARFIEHFSAEATFGPLYDTLTGPASVA